MESTKLVRTLMFVFALVACAVAGMAFYLCAVPTTTLDNGIAFMTVGLVAGLLGVWTLLESIMGE